MAYNTVYESLVQDDADIVGLIAYSLYKHDKREQIVGSMTKNGGRRPNKTQLTHIESVLANQLDYYTEKANQLLDTTVEQLITSNKDEIYVAHFRSLQFELLETQIKDIKKDTSKSIWAELKIEVLGNLAWLLIIIFITIIAYFLNDDVKLLKEKVINSIENINGSNKDSIK